MAQKIILLRQVGMPSDLNYEVAFWLDVAEARQQFYANPAATSVLKGIAAPELASLQAGEIIEVVHTIPAEVGTPLATVKQAARAKLTSLQQELNRDNTFNRYGTSWTLADGWSDVVVA